MNKDELSQLIDFVVQGSAFQSPDFERWVESSRNWQIELGFLNYLFAQLLERKKHHHQECASLILLIYNLVDEMYICIHECNLDFVKYMMRSVRDSSISLEEQLVVLHNNMREYSYD